jgi:hypothetical protein
LLGAGAALVASATSRLAKHATAIKWNSLIGFMFPSMYRLRGLYRLSPAAISGAGESYRFDRPM